MDETFIETLQERAKKSKIYRSYQLAGLEISEILDDAKHKALYIKLAKEGESWNLIRLAKEVREHKNIKNKGAYFMKLITTTKDHGQRSNSRKK